MIRLVIRPLVTMFLLTSVAVGCEGASQDDPVTDEDLARAEREISDALAPGKEDSPNSAIAIVGEIVPGTLVTAEVNPRKRYVGWVFRSEADPDVRATAVPNTPRPEPRPATLMVLYRRTSCLGAWQVVARGAQGLAAKLPGEGEYLLASGLRNPNVSATLQASFTADQVGKIVTDEGRAPKLAKSWLPATAMRALDGAGINSFTELRDPAKRAIAKRAGLSDAALGELQKLATWLDIPWIDYAGACSLKRAGADTANDYYQLSYRAQKALEPAIPLGSIPLASRSAGGACVDLEAPNPSVFCRGDDCRTTEGWTGLRRPAIDWYWKGSNGTGAHPIMNRPWWPTLTAPAPADDPSLQQVQRRWYPDPAQGWDLLGYQLGGTTGGDFGYLLFNHRNSGAMRLFVYIPGVNRGWQQLLATVSLIDKDGQKTGFWSFPLTDRPPAPITFVPATDALMINSTVPAAPGPEFQSSALRASAIWAHTGVDFENLSGGTTSGSGTWVRTDLPTLFDSNIYPATRGARLSTLSDLVKVRVEFAGLQTSNVDLWADLKVDQQGNAIPTDYSAGGRTDLGAARDTFTTGISAAAAGAGVLGFLAYEGVSTGTNPGRAIIAGLGIVGGFFGLMGGDDDPVPPQYKIALAGVARGRVTGRSYSFVPVSALDIYLDQTFKPVCSWSGDPSDPANPYGYHCTPLGNPAAYQRCSSARFGAVGFVSADGRSNDPRPARIPVTLTACNANGAVMPNAILASENPTCATTRTGGNLGTPATLQLGALRAAPWAAFDIVDQRAQLEVSFDHDTSGLPAAIAGGLSDHIRQFIHRQKVGGNILVNAPGPMIIGGLQITRDDMNRILAGQGKVYLRWLATLRPRDPRAKVTEWQYAIDVTDRLAPPNEWITCRRIVHPGDDLPGTCERVP